MCEDNLASHTFVVGTGRSILIAFLDNCGNSLILHQNSANSSSWRLVASVGPEILCNFCTVLKLWVYFALWMFFLMHHFVVSSISHLENTGLLNCVDIRNVITRFTISKSQNSSEKSLSIWKLLVADSFQKFWILLKNSNFTTDNKYSQLFPWKKETHFISSLESFC